MRGLATTSFSDSTLVISWVHPGMLNGFITSFMVSLNDLAQRKVTDYMTSDGEVTNYTVSSLSKREN